MLIKNGRIINPATNLDFIGDLLIKDGKVVSIEENIDSSTLENIEIIDAKNMVVSPGLIDVHVHFRDPGYTYKEDILSGANSAKAGGFTSVILMANTNPKVDDLDTLNYVLKKGKTAPINIFQEAALTKDFKNEIVDMEGLFEAGAAGFTNDGVPVMDTDVLREALLRAKKLGAIIALHEEDNKLIYNHGVNAGPVSEKLGLKGALRASEDVMVSRDCALALDTGATIDIQHLSSGNSVDIIRMFKSLGAKVIAEVTPHHFTLTQEAVLEHSTLAKMNPPLRSEWDRQKIVEGLKDDTIELIATDHAPHAFEEKDKEFKSSPSGIIGLETALPLAVTTLVKKEGMDFSKIIEKMSYNPSKFYNLDRGDISVGKIADICIFDPEEEFTVEKFYSKSSNSPFIGKKLSGKVKFTICSGKIVFKD